MKNKYQIYDETYEFYNNKKNSRHQQLKEMLNMVKKENKKEKNNV